MNPKQPDIFDALVELHSAVARLRRNLKPELVADIHPQLRETLDAALKGAEAALLHKKEINRQVYDAAARLKVSALGRQMASDLMIVCAAAENR